MKRKYSIGLDIGVGSVGWACMTPDFRIPKFNGRYAIGVREFESAETAESRRIQRGTRRRYNRRIRRIQLLQQTLSPLFKNDPNFFIQNDEEEKHFWRHSNQFENNSLSETLQKLGKNKRYYPTIYHLRHDLIQNTKEFHPRLIYIAIHNLVKFRGHFLNENMTWNRNDNDEDLLDLLKEFFIELEVHAYPSLDLDVEQYDSIIKILESDNYTNSDKRTEILKIIGREFRQPISLILGLRANMAQLFAQSDHVDTYKEEKLRISFLTEDMAEVLDNLTSEEQLIIEKGNVIFQTILLKDLLGDATYIAESKVKDYDQFGKDLATLKNIYNNYLGEKAYRAMFITSRKNQSKYNETRQAKYLCTFDQFLKIKATEDKFYRDLKRVIDDLRKKNNLTDDDKNQLDSVYERLDNDNFLIKQKGLMNAAIPHQNNMYEAEMILKNQQKYYPEITDEMIDRVKQIINFRIPYYIGPLIKNTNNEKSKFGWAVRKQDSGRVKPWTIDEVIDRSKSAEQFINKMTSFCSYLTNEKVLPKHSLSYELFEVLNELNSIQIRTQDDIPNRKYRLDKTEKQWIIENVFLKYKNVTHNILKRELKKSKYKHILFDSHTNRERNIYGTQQENRFNTSLSTHIDMINIFGSLKNIDKKMIEEIIYWITVFEEKSIIELKIKEKYSDLTDRQIRRLINLNYTGWGRLSNRLLNEFEADQVNHLTILDIMKQEPYNFMEVLSIEKYNLNERITEYNTKSDEKLTRITYRDIEQLQGSPALKKGIWQAILIIEELTDIFGEPENIMIEFARDDATKEQTKSRKAEIRDIQRAISKDEEELKAFLQNHIQYEDARYRDNRLYLYITQQGKCMYSGEPLNVSRLQDYDVDHILPRSFVKDDSIDNLALVTQKMNHKKGHEKMPLEIIKDKRKQQAYWQKLFDNNLISQQKYYRLMKESFSDQDKESFFARQLVETRQITRHVRDLLKERFEHAEIHPVNANIVSSLRESSRVFKIRELNNKHHAVDAILTVLIVQFIINKYGVNFLNFNFKYQEARKKWRDMLFKQRKNFFLFSEIDNYDKFTHYQTGELLKGRQFLAMLNDEIPWQTTKKIGSNEAAFYDETIYSPNHRRGRKPQYKSGKLAQGVHSDVKVDSSYLISYKFINKNNKENVVNDIVNFRVIEKYQTKYYSKQELAHFLANKVSRGKVIDAKIHARILKHQQVMINNHPFYFISSREMNNAKQFILDKKILERMYKIKEEKKITKDFLIKTYKLIANSAIEQYKDILPEGRINNIQNYVAEITDLDSYKYGINELFKMAHAGAGRSTSFGGRYTRKLDLNEAQFVHQSITGLRFRKPKSYKNELWLS